MRPSSPQRARFPAQIRTGGQNARPLEDEISGRDEGVIRAEADDVYTELERRIPRLRRARRRREQCAVEFGKLHWRYLRQVELLGVAHKKAWQEHPELKKQWDALWAEFVERCEDIARESRAYG